MKIFSRYSRPKSPSLVCEDASRTEQVYKKQCDINYLIERYHLQDSPENLQAVVSPDQVLKMSYVNCLEVPDIYTAIRQHMQVSKLFESAPYATQARFNFSVDAFASYVLNAKSAEEINTLGIENLKFSIPVQPKDGASVASSEEQKIEAKA